MAHPNEDIVRQGYKAFGEGDMDTLASLYAPDADPRRDREQPAGRRVQGRRRHPRLLRPALRASSNGTFSAELQSTKAEGDDTVVASHRNKGQRGDKTLDQDEQLTFTLVGRQDHTPGGEALRPGGHDDFWS